MGFGTLFPWLWTKNRPFPVSLSRESSVLLLMLLTWRELWEANPQLLASVFRFLNVVWGHAFEHMAVFQPLRSDADFWDQIVSAACAEVGPAPDYEIIECTVFDEVARSNHHEAIAVHAYCTLVRSFALLIVSLDIGIHIQLDGSEPSTKKGESYLRILPQLKSQDELTELLAEASPSSFAPQLHDSITELPWTYPPTTRIAGACD